MSIFLFIIFGIPLLSLVWWAWSDHRLGRMNTHRSVRILFGLALTLLLVGFTWVILARREVIATPVPPALYAAVLLWGLIFLPFLAVPMMSSWSILALVRAIKEKFLPSSTPPQPSDADPQRRKLLGTAALSFPVLATFGAAGLSLPQTQRFRIRDLTLQIANLPAELEGVTIAHVTDTHIGKFTNGPMLEKIADATNQLDADLILLTGDLIDNSIKDLPAALAMLKQMQARHGLFMVEGNHDLFDDPREFVRQTRASGIALLRNQSAIITVRGHPVQIMGLVWNRSESGMANDVETVMQQKDSAAFPILLAHHPHAFDAASEHGIPLTLAGHTHGGQLMVTQELGMGPAMYKYWSGLYEKSGQSLVVGNGTGNWFPIRTQAPAEIIHLTLRRA